MPDGQGLPRSYQGQNPKWASFRAPYDSLPNFQNNTGRYIPGDIISQHKALSVNAYFFLTFSSDSILAEFARQAAKEGIVKAVKWYPAGATTNSDLG